ncbi:hypothetical protein B484DRAFT_445688 [Ochromonadaceae sp. CCMP2298]|nr:hypothetical protein B484DRAFT_445688 [Ochromonadaceae sp. CCMP2298]
MAANAKLSSAGSEEMWSITIKKLTGQESSIRMNRDCSVQKLYEATMKLMKVRVPTHINVLTRSSTIKGMPRLDHSDQRSLRDAGLYGATLMVLENQRGTGGIQETLIVRPTMRQALHHRGSVDQWPAGMRLMQIQNTSVGNVVLLGSIGSNESSSFISAELFFGSFKEEGVSTYTLRARADGVEVPVAALMGKEISSIVYREWRDGAPAKAFSTTRAARALTQTGAVFLLTQTGGIGMELFATWKDREPAPIFVGEGDVEAFMEDEDPGYKHFLPMFPADDWAQLACDNPTCPRAPGTSEINSLKTCGRCQTSKYCGPECQRAAWGVHKSECRELEK